MYDHTRPHTRQESSPTRLRTFDFLRGLAILGVIAVHTSQSFPSQISAIDFVAGLGRFGVQLFYFISALTMCHMWKLREGESHPVKNFYIRRFFRIAPLFWIAIPVYLLINGYEKSYWAPEGIGALQIFLTATFLHGFWPNSINSVVPGGWSIAVEMTFYALFPLLILKIKRRNVYLLLAFITWGFNIFIFRDFVSNFLTNHYDTSSTTIIENYLYLNFINQAPIFLLGCYLYFTLNAQPKKIEAYIFVAWILLGAGLRFFYNIGGFGFLAVYIALGMFVYVCIKANIRFKTIEKIGKSSYAIYLVHFLVLHYLQEIMPLKTGLSAFLVGITLTTFISYLLAFIIFKFIESNVQHFVDMITKPKITRL
jgi:peptidoglycan/LPS O-acetylase OafA/YrhL